MSSRVADVSQSDFETVVVQGSATRPVVVDFWADWCGPCHQLSPMIESAAAQFDGDVDVVKVDIDANPGLAQQFGVRGIPAVKAFADGKVVAEFTGVQPPAAVTQFFAALAPSDADRLVQQAGATAGAEDRRALYQRAIELQADHPGAALGLAADLDDEEAIGQVLAQARPTPEVTQAMAELKIRQNSVDEGGLAELRQQVADGDDDARVELGAALAAAGAHDEAIAVLLDAVRIPATREEGRQALLDIFSVLGADDPRVVAARPKLAAALF